MGDHGGADAMATVFHFFAPHAGISTNFCTDLAKTGERAQLPPEENRFQLFLAQQVEPVPSIGPDRDIARIAITEGDTRGTDR